MSDYGINEDKYNKFQQICSDCNNLYISLYQLKTENEKELHSIYEKIKTILIDSKQYSPQNIICDILNIVPYNNRYIKSYLELAKLISDDYHVNEVTNIPYISNFMFYNDYGIKLCKSQDFMKIDKKNHEILKENKICKAIINNDRERFISFTESERFNEDKKIRTHLHPYSYIKYGIKLDKSEDFEIISSEELEIHTENTIYRAIMYNNLETFIQFTEIDGFDKNQTLKSYLYPKSRKGYSLLELCCYHGAVDCFKLLRTKFNSKITQTCLEFSFLGGNPDIMSECLKYQQPGKECMDYAIISHNIDFVTFLMNEYNLKIDLESCVKYKNLESFFVVFDQTNDADICFYYSINFNVPLLCEYFLPYCSNINKKYINKQTALHSAIRNQSDNMVELLLSHGACVSEKDLFGKTALHYAAEYNCERIAELLISHDANVNEKDNSEQTALHIAAEYNRKETAELLISHGANVNEKDSIRETALYIAIEKIILK